MSAQKGVKTVILAPVPEIRYKHYYCNYCKNELLRYDGEQYLEIPYNVPLKNGLTIKCKCDFIYQFTWM